MRRLQAEKEAQAEKTVDYSKLKKDEIKDILVEKGIEFDENAKKDELLALLGEE